MEAVKPVVMSARAWLNMPELGDALYSLAPVWGLFLAGVLVGQLLPRLTRVVRLPKALPISSLLTRWSQAVLVFHLAVILKEVWHHVAHPGTLRGLLRATVQWACGRGWSFQWPASVGNGGLLDANSESSSEDGEAPTGSAEWYVSERDLTYFQRSALEDAPLEGATPWELMFDKDVPGFVRYTAWRRTLPCGKAEYKSVTVAPDVTPQEFMDMYLDDAFRRNWDGMVIHHEVLEHGDFNERQQVVRWIRRFPFAFLSDREYAIARRLFRGADGSLTACTKAINHPREYKNSNVVRMDVFWSHWRSRAVPDPWGGGKTACETVLLHHEQFKIPERLARFAVTHGMWGFVRKLSATVPQYAEARRRRCHPLKEDPAAYGAGFAPNPPHRHGADVEGAADEADGSACGKNSAARTDAYRPRKGGAARKAVLLVAGIVALAVCASRGGASAARRRRRTETAVKAVAAETAAAE